MSVALEVEQAVAGFVNTSPDGMEFTIEDVNDYIMSLWNAGCGPVRLNFTQQDLRHYLNWCRGICLSKNHPGYKIDKSLLEDDLSDKERKTLNDDKKRIWSFLLFCELRVDLNTPDRLLSAMGFRFMYKE